MMGVQRQRGQGKWVDPRNKGEELHAHQYGVPGNSLAWPPAAEENTMRNITEALHASSSNHGLSQHKGMDRSLPNPSFFYRARHFPAEIQLYKPASISFICRRLSWAVTLVPQPACKSSQQPGTSQKVTSLFTIARDDCPSAVRHAPGHFLIIYIQGTFLVWFLLSKKSHNKPQLLCLLTYAYSPVVLIFRLNFFFPTQPGLLLIFLNS